MPRSPPGVPRIVYVSTLNVFGNTRGELKDETYRRDLGEGFLSYYDETKFRAHEAAEKRIAAGAPDRDRHARAGVRPHDHSLASAQLEQAYNGKLRSMALTDLAWPGCTSTIWPTASSPRSTSGRAGEAYALAGDSARLGESIAIAARLGGRRPPRLTMPTCLCG